MQLINQIYMLLLALILLGIFFSSAYITRHKNLGDQPKLWPASILTRCIAFIAWAFAPLLGDGLLIIANSFFVASAIMLALFIRSWRTSLTARVFNVSVIILVGYLLAFVYLLSLPDSFQYRATLTAVTIFLVSVWEFSEVLRKAISEKSYLLKLLVGVVFFQIALLATAIAQAFLNWSQNAHSLVQADVSNQGMLFFWIVFGVHLLSYVIISSYLYGKLWESERHTYNELIAKELRLSESEQEYDLVVRLLKERENLVESLLKVNKTAATGALAASIAHEMAQPLAVISMNTEFLDKLSHQPPIQPELLHQMLRGIRASNEHAANIVNTLRAIFLEMPPVFVRTNLLQLVNNVVQLARSSLDRQCIRVDIDISETLAPDLYANELSQVLLNLINNAIKALSLQTPGAGRISISAQVADDQLTLCIADNGPGVPVELEPRLFQLFEHGGNSGSMGLGLWLCAHIMQRHRGSIRYESNPGGGARFLLQCALATDTRK